MARKDGYAKKWFMKKYSNSEISRILKYKQNHRLWNVPRNKMTEEDFQELYDIDNNIIRKKEVQTELSGQIQKSSIKVTLQKGNFKEEFNSLNAASYFLGYKSQTTLRAAIEQNQKIKEYSIKTERHGS